MGRSAGVGCHLGFQRFFGCLEQFANFGFKKIRTKGINGVEGGPLRATQISRAIGWLEVSPVF